MTKKGVKVIYTPQAVKNLKKLDIHVADKIVIKVADSCRDDPLAHAKTMKAQYDGYYRFRIGNHRVIFEYLEDGQVNIVNIVRVGHRKNIYKK